MVGVAAIGDAWLYGTPRWVLAQTRQEACDRLETTVMRPSGTRENKQTNKQSRRLVWDNKIKKKLCGIALAQATEETLLSTLKCPKNIW
jgi:hypothetical protein